MGLLTALVTLPLAPVRGVVRLTEALVAIAEEEMNSQDALRDELRGIEELHQEGLIDDAELERRWDAVMERMAAVSRAGAP